MSKIQPKLSFVVVRLNGRNVVAVRATVGAAVKFQEHLDRMTFLGESDRCEAELVKAQREAEAECRAAVKAIKDLDEKASYADVAKAQKRLDAALVLAEFASVEEIPEEIPAEAGVEVGGEEKPSEPAPAS